MADEYIPSKLENKNSIEIARMMGWRPVSYRHTNAHWGKSTEPLLVVIEDGAHIGPRFSWPVKHDQFVRIETAALVVINDRPLTPYDDDDLETYWHLLPNFYRESNAHHALSAIAWGTIKFADYREYIALYSTGILVYRSELYKSLDRLAVKVMSIKEAHDNIQT